VHYVVPGGGLRADGRKWIAARQADWLLPVAKLAAVFRARLERALFASAPQLHAAVPAGTWRRPWVVHSQPAGLGANVVKYLARYVGRTAISDERIVSADDETVTFKYTDSATQQRKVSTVRADEFMRRYLQHVLPPGQHRVRYFGWMHPSGKRRRMKVETLLAKPIVVMAAVPPPPAWHLRCPHCAGFALVRVGTLPRMARGPPRCSR
jgi:putative transposase